jgi:Domain of unknown function (DUF3854)
MIKSGTLTEGSIPLDSEAGNYLLARGIALEFAASHGVRWTCDEGEFGRRLDRFFENNPQWYAAKLRDMVEAHDKGLDAPIVRRRRSRRGWSPRSKFINQELLSFPIWGAESWAWFNKLFPILDGDKSKGFRTTRGAKQPIFIPQETWEARRDSSQPIFLTEGPVKALALLQAGVLSVGLAGTWASEPAAGGKLRQLMRVLQKFEWRDRKVYLVFDADQRNKTPVRQSVIRNFLMLTLQGAQVRQLTAWQLEEGKALMIICTTRRTTLKLL